MDTRRRTGETVREVGDALGRLSREFFNGRLEEEIAHHTTGKSRTEAVDWARGRFGAAWNQQRFDQQDGDLTAALFAQGREMLRWELTRLEQFVLLRIYDQAWKDHLLEMDHLKTAIMQRPLGGDQTHPQSQYAIEGRDLFTQMWARIAARVTEIIFKVQATDSDKDAGGEAGGGLPMVFRHAEATGAGFAGGASDQAAAMQAQNTDGKIATIRRDKPKVKRNDPCPCGSGKKYKHCHGKT